MKHLLGDELSIFLLRNGFTVKNTCSSCFDLVARNDDRILLIKVLHDANAVSREYAEEMKRIASQITAVPLIVAEKANELLEDNVVYTRFGINTLNLNTFSACVRNNLPFVKRTRAGLTAVINGKKLAEILEELSMSTLARRIGVSQRMIANYKEGSEVTINRASAIYNFLGGDVFEKINIFDFNLPLQQEAKTAVSKKYLELGFDALETRKVPFDVIARKEHELILTEVGDEPKPELESLTRLLDADNLVIFSRKKPKDIPAIREHEFMEFETAKELMKFLKEFE